MPELPRASQGRLEKFGREQLGPVIELYLARLHSYLSHCQSADHRILFCMRAGVRIRELYQTWLAARSLAEPANAGLLKISRLMAIKASYQKAPELAVTALGRESAGIALGDILNGLMRTEIAAGRCPDLGNTPPAPLHEFLRTGEPHARLVRTYLERQSALYRDYLLQLAGGATRLVLVDSGWRGTPQLLLEAAFPEYSWEGVYFGCTGRAEVLGRRIGSRHGLIFDAPHYDPETPETAFLVHRHLIESLLEPDLPSVEQLEPPQAATRKRRDVPATGSGDASDAVYRGVKKHVAQGGARGIAAIERAHHRAMAALQRIVCYPTVDEVALASGKLRSHDLGRPGAASPILPTVDRFEGDSAELRISQSIWAQGQVALEYPPAAAKTRQRKELDALAPDQAAQHFTSHLARAASRKPGQPAATVVIITRTKNRPVLLARAARSVAAQTYPHYCWVVVNDGGDFDAVRETVDACAVAPQKVVVCSNEASVGMEAASNMGIRAADGKYVVIHDDDDSWAPEFLDRAVRFIEGSGDRYGGVITGSVYVSEEVQGTTITEHGRWPYNDWVDCVQLSEMMVGNFFPPIAFLFRRSVWEEIGGFDETLPVLGDWDFNLRFLMRHDIGVLREPLAYYHHRDRSPTDGAYANSVLGAAQRHAEYNAILRNRYLRNALDNPRGPLSALVAAGFYHGETRRRLEQQAAQAAAAGSGPTADKVAELTSKVAALQAELDLRWVQIVAARNVGGQLAEAMQRKDLVRYAKSHPLPPPPDFDESAYLRLYPDVAGAIASRRLLGGFNHYMMFGSAEGRDRPASGAQ